jgi:hypothetical protein
MAPVASHGAEPAKGADRVTDQSAQMVLDWLIEGANWSGRLFAIGTVRNMAREIERIRASPSKAEGEVTTGEALPFWVDTIATLKSENASLRAKLAEAERDEPDGFWSDSGPEYQVDSLEELANIFWGDGAVNGDIFEVCAYKGIYKHRKMRLRITPHENSDDVDYDLEPVEDPAAQAASQPSNPET